MEETTRNCRKKGLQKLLYADDMVAVAESKEEVDLTSGKQKWKKKK